MFLFFVSILCVFIFRFNVVGTCVAAVVAEENAETIDFIFDEPKCILPPPPKNGNYTFLDGITPVRPGHRLHSYALKVECDPGFDIAGNAYPTCSEDSVVTNMPECIRVVQVVGAGENAEADANQRSNRNCIISPAPKNGYYFIPRGNSSPKPGRLPSSVLKVECNFGFQLVGNDYPVCLGLEVEGYIEPECLPLCQWKNPYTISFVEQQDCYVTPFNGAGEPKSPRNQSLSQPQQGDDNECGTVFAAAGHLTGGRTAIKKELPWQAGIYSKLSKPYEQICGGSLVSQSVVISAAHCFWSGVQQLPAENYAVAVGKIYRPWNDKNDVYAQKSDVREIHIPPRFLGIDTRFQDDLALLTLTTPVSYDSAVRPVCLDFDYAFDEKQLTVGALGKVGGWGLKSEDGRASPTLQIADMPYINIEKCVSGVDPSFREYITSDKICAGYSNGTAMCKGDSGGGISFPDSIGGTDRYYLRGVVSTAPRSDHSCAVFHWAAFTHLQRHQQFIQEIMRLESEATTASDETAFFP